MAHGDYACCCICANKMDYEGFSENHKKRLCASCAVALMKFGVEATNWGDVLAWLRANDAATVIPILQAVGFDLCYYENEIDQCVATLRGLPDPARWKSPHDMIDELLNHVKAPPPQAALLPPQEET